MKILGDIDFLSSVHPPAAMAKTTDATIEKSCLFSSTYHYSSLIYTPLPEPKFIEVDAQSDIEIIFRYEALRIALAPFPFQAKVDHRLPLEC